MRFSRKVAFTLAAQALLASTVPGGLLVWNLHTGHADTLAVRDGERLGEFAALAGEAARAGRPLNQVVEALDLRDPEGLGGRVAVIGAGGRRIAGPEGGATIADRPITVDSRTVGSARIVREPLPTAAERAFLARQYIGIGAVVALLFAALLFAGLFFARRWARPQVELMRMSQAIAEGEDADDIEIDGPVETQITARNLQRIAGRFDRLETARRTWLVSTAEELRRPARDMMTRIEALEAIGPAVDAALTDGLREDQAELARMASDLQAVALADLGRLPVSFEPVDPRALIHNAVWGSKKRADGKGVALITGALPQYTILVKWDGTRIEQLFAALIDNSLRYTPRGGTIELGLESRGDTWELLIDDTAPGVDVDMAQRLFEPFYRSAETNDDSVTGSGLGLATARAIVDAHHGRIEAGRSPLGGLRVSVRLPASQPMA